MMKKKMFVVTVLLIFTGLCVFSQDIDTGIRKAVDDLAVNLNAPMELSIGLITIAQTNIPAEFSRYLHNKIKLFAARNDRYRVVEDTGASRGVSRLRPGGSQRGELTGEYQQIGGNFEVSLYLKSLSGGTIIASSSFTVPVSELEKFQIAVLPANDSSEERVREKEKIFTSLPEAEAFRVEAWTDSASGTYYEGDTMTVYFTSDRDCYYKMYYIDTRNNMSLIYPTRQNAANFLRANAVKEMLFLCTKPYGNETFLLMASAEPFVIADSEFAAAEANTAAVEQALRGLQYKGGERPAASDTPVAAARFSYTILPPANPR
jgi:hypothetical protein